MITAAQKGWRAGLSQAPPGLPPAREERREESSWGFNARRGCKSHVFLHFPISEPQAGGGGSLRPRLHWWGCLKGWAALALLQCAPLLARGLLSAGKPPVKKTPFSMVL